ncbi:MAG: hypothetical protein GW823_00090, partial [Bacteroidetes bacterium]|nr:hypothetical protein [Bacteroidota bacterium]
MKNFFKIIALEVLQLNSKTGAVFTGRITFRELLTIHRLTERKESLIDPFGDSKIKKIVDDEEFQRHLNNNKLIDLGKFLESELEDINNSKIIFPSSVIISLDLNENNTNTLNESDIDSFYEKDLNSCFVINKENISEIFIPKNERICLIVDGQHRFYGLKKFYDSIKDKDKKEKILDFQFITSILL